MQLARISDSLICGQVVLTPAKNAMTGAIRKAEALTKQIPNAYSLQQFNNPANPRVHYETTGPEIWRDTCGKVGNPLFCGYEYVISN